MYFFQSQIWRVVNLSNRNLTRIELFNSKLCVSKKAAKMQNMSFSRSKMNQNVIFWMQTFLQSLTPSNFFVSNSITLYFFQSKTLRLVKLFNQNLTRFEFFFKIWRVRKINIKIWQFLKFFSPKSDFYLAFQVLTEWRCFLSPLIPKCFKGKN